MRGFGIPLIILSCSLVGCAPQLQALWVKPGAETDEFQQARYGCLQGSQQPNSTAYIGRYGGAANSGMITNDGLFSACMNARGWALTPLTDVKAFTAAVKPIGEERIAICAGPDMQVLWKKTPCKSTDEITQSQLNDRSKASPQEKVALSKWQDAAVDSNEKLAAAYRQYDTKNGDAVGNTIDNGVATFKQIVSELSSGGISWGEFNRRRSEANKRLLESQKMALSG